MDNRFEYALNKIMGSEHRRNGIGTLSEKTLHAVIKKYFEPHTDSHEVQIGGYVADIVGENGIVEIQTNQLNRLSKKLTAFLECSRVTVVYPMIAKKYLVWLDPNTNALTKRRKSPKKIGIYDAFKEVYGIRNFLLNDNFTLCLCLLQADEIRNLDGIKKNRKIRSTKSDTLPTALLDEVYFYDKFDYMKLIPDTLPEIFDSLEFSRAVQISRNSARHFLNTLTAPNITKRVGKNGNNILFSVNR